MSEAITNGENGQTTQPLRIPAPRGNGYVTPIRSTARGQELAAIRWAKHRKAAADGVARRVGAVATAEDQAIMDAAKGESGRAVAAYGILSGIQAERAYMDGDPQSFRAVRMALGADVGAPVRGENEGGIGVGVDTQSARDMAELLAAYRAWRDGRAGSGGDNSNYSNQSDDDGNGNGSEGE